jgi:hypothetical protein
MKIVFIAGPYFGEGDKSKIQGNIRHAEQYQIALANLGIGFFCPYNHTEHFEVKATADENFYRELDMVYLQKVADAIVAIPGWENSAGARAEIEFAKQKGIPVFYPSSPDDLDLIIGWAKEA